MKRVLKVENYIRRIPSREFYIAIDTDRTNGKMGRLGFNNPPQKGQSILPHAIGLYTTRNFDGQRVTFDDQPKETRDVAGVDWHGNPTLRPRLCYPVKEFKMGVKLVIREVDEKTFVTAGPFTMPDRRTQNTMNMFIELFDDFIVLGTDEDGRIIPPPKKVNWVILHAGSSVFDKKERIENIIVRLPQLKQADVRARFALIDEFGDHQVAEGQFSFNGYIAHIFENVCLLEPTRTGNATYVVRASEWEALSQLTKRQLVRGTSLLDRIVHSTSWAKQMKSMMKEQNHVR